MRVVRKTAGALAVAVGADEVLGWCPMPTGAKLLSVTGALHVVKAENAAIAQFQAYGFSGYVVPVVDPTSSLSLKATWDTMVVKQGAFDVDTGAGGIDYEWDVVDTNEVVQPGRGRAEIASGFGMEKSKVIFEPKIEWLSSAKRFAGHVPGTPDAWQPLDYKRFRSQMKITASEPSYALIAVSNPALTEVNTAPVTDGTTELWGMGMHLREILQDFWKVNAGLIEVGAESPYADASTYIQELVAPNVLDESTTLFDDSDPMTAFMECTWIMDFPDGDSVTTIRG